MKCDTPQGRHAARWQTRHRPTHCCLPQRQRAAHHTWAARSLRGAPGLWCSHPGPSARCSCGHSQCSGPAAAPGPGPCGPAAPDVQLGHPRLRIGAKIFFWFFGNVQCQYEDDRLSRQVQAVNKLLSAVCCSLSRATSEHPNTLLNLWDVAGRDTLHDDQGHGGIRLSPGCCGPKVDTGAT